MLCPKSALLPCLSSQGHAQMREDFGRVPSMLVFASRCECNRLCGSLAGRGRTPSSQTTLLLVVLLQYCWLTKCFSGQRQDCDYLTKFSWMLSRTHTEHMSGLSRHASNSHKDLEHDSAAGLHGCIACTNKTVCSSLLKLVVT